MAADRLLRILGRLARAGGSTPCISDLLGVVRDLLAMTGAEVMLVADGAAPILLRSTDSASALLQRVQCELGEGPAFDACRTRVAVQEPDLLEPVAPRWPLYTSAATRAGVRAVFAAPMQVGGARLGALSVWRDRRGPLNSDQHADFLVLVEVATRLVLDILSSRPHEGSWLHGEDLGFDTAVHQATGMVAGQLDVTLEIALLRLRAHAFAEGRPLSEVATDVLARRLRLDPDPPPGKTDP